MAEPTVNFNLRMPVEVDKAVRADAKRTGKGVNATLIAWLSYAFTCGVADATTDPAIAEKLERSTE